MNFFGERGYNKRFFTGVTFVIFLTIMNWINVLHLTKQQCVLLQITCLRKWVTFLIKKFFKCPVLYVNMTSWNIILQIFFTIMNWINVCLQIPCMSKWLSTWVTFMISLTSMNCITVSGQVPCLRKWLSTRITFVIFLTIMNWINVCLQIS